MEETAGLTGAFRTRSALLLSCAALALAAPLSAQCPFFTAVTGFTADTTTVQSAVADFDGDGKLDVVASNQDSGDVSVFFGDGAGGLSMATNYAVGGTPAGIAVGDFTGDGKPDIVVANVNGIAFLRNLGAGTFAPTTFISTGAGIVVAVAVGFFNNDTNLDLAVTNLSGPGTGIVSILLGNGDGTFGAPLTSSPVGNIATSLAVGDFNHDSKLDVATANRGSSSVTVLLGTGTGTLGTGVSYAVGANPFAIAVADLDNDGNLDIVTGNHDDRNISFLKGDGLGGFGTAISTPARSEFYSVSVADFTGDGIPDVAAASLDAGVVVVYPGLGNGSFSPPSAFSVPTPYSSAVGNFDADPKPDIVTTSYFGSEVDLLLNGCVPAPTISSFTPPSGPTAGGNSVTINGTHLSGATSATFGATSGIITSITDIQLIVTAPAEAAGAVSLNVTTPSGTATAGSNYTFVDAPSITTQPQNVSIVSGQTATLTVTASGTGLQYQWYQGTSGVTTTPVGTNSSSYTTPPLTSTTHYWVRVSNIAGNADSNTATVTVTVCGVAITQQPLASWTVQPGATTTLSVVATGPGPLTYQWYQGNSGDTSTPVGTNSSSFAIPPAEATIRYWVRVTGSCGSVDSNTTVITVLPPCNC